MPHMYFHRKDYVDTRPIPILGPKYDSFQWKLRALLEHNRKGSYILPFSRRAVDNYVVLLWPRTFPQPPPPGFQLCGCDGCEKKKWQDHLLKDDDDDEVSAFGNLHLDSRHEDTDNDDVDDDDVEHEDKDNDEYDEEDSENSTTWLTDCEIPTPTGDTDSESSPFFPGDPFESFDWEC